MAKKKEKVQNVITEKIQEHKEIKILKEKEKNELLDKIVDFTMDFISTLNLKKSLKEQNTITYCPITSSHGISICVDTDVFNDHFVWFSYSQGPKKGRYDTYETNSHSISRESVERCIKRLMRQYEL